MPLLTSVGNVCFKILCTQKSGLKMYFCMFVAVVAINMDPRLAKTLLDRYRSIFTKPIFLARTDERSYSTNLTY